MRLLSRVACLFTIVVINGCSGTSRHEVFGIERTGTYHRGGCPPVHMAKTVMMTREEARARHLKPCPVCKPDSQ